MPRLLPGRWCWFRFIRIAAAETLEQLIAGAKKESELTFIAGAQTFGGPKTLNLLEAAFNKRFGLNMKIRFAAGPEMNSMAARMITELKNGSKASSDIYHGSQSHVSLLHKEKALEQVNYSAIFPWITKPMEIFPNEGVLIFTSLRGMIYNSKSHSQRQSAEDLRRSGRSEVKSDLGRQAGDSALCFLAGRAVDDLERGQGQELYQEARRAERRPAPLQRRGARRQRRVSDRGQHGRRDRTDVAVASQGRAAGGGDRLDAGAAVLFSTGACRSNSAHPNLAKLFIGFMASKEAQEILEK